MGKVRMGMNLMMEFASSSSPSTSSWTGPWRRLSRSRWASFPGKSKNLSLDQLVQKKEWENCPWMPSPPPFPLCTADLGWLQALWMHKFDFKPVLCSFSPYLLLTKNVFYALGFFLLSGGSFKVFAKHHKWCQAGIWPCWAQVTMLSLFVL